METNIDNNTNNDQQQSGFWHSSWAYAVFFVGLILIMISISYLIKMII